STPFWKARAISASSPPPMPRNRSTSTGRRPLPTVDALGGRTAVRATVVGRWSQRSRPQAPAVTGVRLRAVEPHGLVCPPRRRPATPAEHAAYRAPPEADAQRSSTVDFRREAVGVERCGCVCVPLGGRTG